MKFKVQMKDPDVLHDAIQDAVKADLERRQITDEEEQERLTELHRERIGELCGRWFRYGEYLTVEIDTDDRTCTVCPARD